MINQFSKKTSHKLTLASCLIGLFVLGGCAQQNPYGDAYSTSDTRQVQSVQTGVITQLEAVTIDGKGGNEVGTVAGGAIGGILGSKVGGGTGSDIAAVGGAILGGLLGGEAGKAVRQQQGVNIIIKLDNGRTISVVQAVNPKVTFQVGQKVNIFSSGSTTRVSPAY